MKFADQCCDELVSMGYTHCLFVAGGNIMHLIEASRTRFHMVPLVHEVAAVIGAEYFNETSLDGRKAFALVTAGPGVTNAMTGIAGAWLESREVLILGGQVKSIDLACKGVRQMGIQELDGVSVAAPITKASARIERPIPMTDLRRLVQLGTSGRPGPVFLEFCLDAQAAPAVRPGVDSGTPLVHPRASTASSNTAARSPLPDEWRKAMKALDRSSRPLILLGGGVSRAAARELRPALESLGIPVAVTWNGCDRLPADSPIYAGRPNTWGMRWANLALQQTDFLLGLGTRLSLQQTGFAWEDFAPLARIVQVDIDQAELEKGRPNIDWKVCSDADLALADLVSRASPRPEWSEWRVFVQRLREALPVVEEENYSDGPELVPQRFVEQLSDILEPSDILIPCSSGGTFTVAMQVFANKDHQLVVSNKALASMGYGLAGAIGASLANPLRRVVLTEGDGGFAQNLQELGTVAVNNLNVKIFVMSNQGYASIRTTQRNYFGGAYVGCDRPSGLGLPDWRRVADAWDIPFERLSRNWASDPSVEALLQSPGPALFEVPVSQEQAYWPKIGSRVLSNGSMQSAPLHQMSPILPGRLVDEFMPYLSKGEVL